MNRLEKARRLALFAHVHQLTHSQWVDPLWQWTSNLASGLEYLHSVSYFDHSRKVQVDHLVHRDLKPENLFITENNTLKLGDFGETKMVNEDRQMTQVGTPLYIAPEVLKGDAYGTA